MIDLVESSGVFDHMVALTRLMTEHPALIARHATVQDTTSNVVLAEIARRTGTDPAVDLYPRLVLHAANAVSRAVVEQHITPAAATEPSRRSPADALREGFAQLRAGLPQPHYPAAAETTSSTLVD